MGQLGEIVEGFKNLLFKNELVEPIALKRMEICATCPLRTDDRCDRTKGGCGCLLAAKIRSLKSKCPKDKW